MGYWHTFHYCNSAPRVSGPAAGRGGAGAGVYVLFFPRSGFGFSYLAVSQTFHWYLISRDKSRIVTQCYTTVQWLCK